MRMSAQRRVEVPGGAAAEAHWDVLEDQQGQDDRGAGRQELVYAPVHRGALETQRLVVDGGKRSAEQNKRRPVPALTRERACDVTQALHCRRRGAR